MIINLLHLVLEHPNTRHHPCIEESQNIVEDCSPDASTWLWHLAKHPIMCRKVVYMTGVRVSLSSLPPTL